jgi:hypothetical protein
MERRNQERLKNEQIEKDKILNEKLEQEMRAAQEMID